MFGKKRPQLKEPQSFSPLFETATNAQLTSLNSLFVENPTRFQEFCFELGQLKFDFSKTHITADVLAAFEKLAGNTALFEKRDQLLSGGIVNSTERRPALHTAVRATNPIPKDSEGNIVAAEILAQRDACYSYAENVRSGEVRAQNGKPYRYIIHLGIGGSALGPQLLLDTLAFGLESDFETHCVANVDGHALKPVMDACDPAETLVIVASKTFTTTETLSNARALMQWMSDAGVDSPFQQLAAVTAAPDQAKAFGISESSIMTFPEELGGRYSIWSSVSLVAIIVLGKQAFESMRAGAELMDNHFAKAPAQENIPLIAAMLDLWYGNSWGAPTRALFAYDSRLSVLVQYLQQLEMENNGKNISSEGTEINWQSSPILWGGVGTDSQHAVFQLVHQGTHLIPTEFIAVLKAEHDLDEHHRCLLANCFAQSAALMKGRTTEEAAARLTDDSISTEQKQLLSRSKTFSGNRPSTTIVLDALNPESLGSLIAFYEHRSFVSGTLWEINVFDQMGVELGKELAKSYQEIIESGDFGSLGLDSSTKNLLGLVLD
jgi:glucose-6-phosphate isomerase